MVWIERDGAAPNWAGSCADGVIDRCSRGKGCRGVGLSRGSWRPPDRDGARSRNEFITAGGEFTAIRSARRFGPGRRLNVVQQRLSGARRPGAARGAILPSANGKVHSFALHVGRLIRRLRRPVHIAPYVGYNPQVRRASELRGQQFLAVRQFQWKTVSP